MNNWITPYIKQHKGRITFAVFFALLGVASGAMLLFMSGYLISKSSLRPENIMIVYVPIVAVRAFSIGQAVFPYLEKLVSHDIVLRILAKYRNKLYKLLEPQTVFLQSRFKTGDLLGILSDDIEKLQDFYIRTLLPSITGLIVYTVIAIVVGFFDLIFMVILLAVLGVIVFLMPMIGYFVMIRNHLFIKEQKGKLYQHITDAMFGQLDWLISGRVKEVVSNVATQNKRLMERETKVYRWHHFRDAFLHLIIGIVIIAMMVWTDIQTDQGAISPTIIAAFVLMMFSITESLLPINNAVEEVPTYLDSLKRMNTIENKSINHLVEADKQPRNNHPTMMIDKVSYRYATSEKKTINDLSLTIQPGKKLAILGKSGTGKSTLLKLLAGVIQPDSGKVLLDDVAVHREMLANYISVLNQKPHLFHTTIANNIRIGKNDATDEEIKEVLKVTQILDMIESLPKGIHTQMEEMGKRFSGGERQRIAFARVLIQQTPIVLIDEPATGLDPITERALLTTMLQAAKDRTVILVTHHLACAELMDEIIFLDEGQIKLQGNHQQLIDTNSYYKTLYEMDEGIL